MIEFYYFYDIITDRIVNRKYCTVDPRKIYLAISMLTSKGGRHPHVAITWRL